MIKGKDADEVDCESEDGDDEELFYFEDFFGPDQSAEGFDED
jgi:hypothetical protein